MGSCFHRSTLSPFAPEQRGKLVPRETNQSESNKDAHHIPLVVTDTGELPLTTIQELAILNVI